MRSEPNIVVTCDCCETETISIELTALARKSYDERNVEEELKSNGWKTEDGEDICPTCQEEGESSGLDTEESEGAEERD